MIGVDLEGRKQVLGIWLEPREGSRFRLNVLTLLRNRGLKDALVVCCDGLTGLPDAINHVWPEAIVQTCVVHLLRTSMRYVACTDRKKIAAKLKPIHTAPTLAAAEAGLGTLRTEFAPLGPGRSRQPGSGPGRRSSRSSTSRSRSGGCCTRRTRSSR